MHQGQKEAEQKPLRPDTPDSSGDDTVCTLQDQFGHKHSKITIKDTIVEVIVDSGATANIIDDMSYDKLKPSCKLQPSTAKIYPYGSSTALPLRGEFKATVHSKMRIIDEVTFYVVQGNHGSRRE